MEMIKELIRPELMILIPVLYFIGMGLKKSATFADKHIPVLLGATSIILATIYIAATTPPASGVEFLNTVFAGVTQGVLCAGCSVYANQIVKQTGKDEE